MGTPPLAGTLEAIVERADAVSLHGDVYVDLVVRPAAETGPAGTVRVRVASHVAGGRTPTIGERVRLSFLLGQVTGLAYVGSGAGPGAGAGTGAGGVA